MGKGKDIMEIRYRQIRKEDGYEWYTLLSRVWRASYAHILPEEYFDARDRSVESRAAEFTEELFAGDRKIAYVAEHEGKIVGLIFGTLDSNYDYFKGSYADLVAIYIYPEYQGMGIGTALKDIFVKWARTKNADRYVVGVLKENHKARRVYESWGGRLSEHEQDYMIMGRGYPEVFYVFEIEQKLV